MYPLEAAVDLLIAHHTWLRRRDFRRAALRVSDDGPELIGVDWTAARDLTERAPASRSELAMLTIAARLAGQDHPCDLGDVLTGLDQTNTAIVLHAIAHSVGWHEHGHCELVAGNVPSDCGRLTDLDRTPHSDGC